MVAMVVARPTTNNAPLLPRPSWTSATRRCWSPAALRQPPLVPTRRELGFAVFEYMEAFSHRERRHSSLGMLSPADGPRST